jgi:hypothetical protein
MTVVRAALAVLGVLFAGASVVLLVLSLKRAAAVQRLASWRKAKATVTSVGFEARGTDLGVLRVLFDVEGRPSSALDIGDEERRVAQREELLTTFAVGTTHDALVDPSGQAPPLLVTGLAQSPAGMAILSAIFLVPVGILFGLAWYLGQR